MDDFDNHPNALDKLDPCILCMHPWINHHGFACPETAHHYSFADQNDLDKLPREHRFFTTGMRARLVKYMRDAVTLRPAELPSYEMVSKDEQNDWKFFQNSATGECPCGTNRSVCKYH